MFTVIMFISILLIFQFLGGLSLHLNHLIVWHMRISFQQFGTLPIGIFCQIWSQDSLRYLLGPLNFDICQFLPFEYFGQNHGSSENQFFFDEGATGHQSVLGGFRWAGT